MTTPSPAVSAAARSPDVRALLAGIAEGASERERRDESPFAQVAAVAEAGLGALSLPVDEGGQGAWRPRAVGVRHRPRRGRPDRRPRPAHPLQPGARVPAPPGPRRAPPVARRGARREGARQRDLGDRAGRGRRPRVRHAPRRGRRAPGPQRHEVLQHRHPLRGLDRRRRPRRGRPGGDRDGARPTARASRWSTTGTAWGRAAPARGRRRSPTSWSTPRTSCRGAAAPRAAGPRRRGVPAALPARTGRGHPALGGHRRDRRRALAQPHVRARARPAGRRRPDPAREGRHAWPRRRGSPSRRCSPRRTPCRPRWTRRRAASPTEERAPPPPLAHCAVKVHLDRASLEAASELFDVGGASASSRARNLDRHWRNLRTITLHNPASYKAAAIGRHLVTGEPLPVNGYF